MSAARDVLGELHKAIVEGNNARALQLIARPCMKEHINKKIGMGTCLHLACMNNNTEVCQAMLDIGADPEVSETYGGKALHMASDKGHLDCVKLLVTHGNANVNATCGQGYTACYLAELHGHKDVVDYLKQRMGNDKPNQGTKCTKRQTSVNDCPFYQQDGGLVNQTSSSSRDYVDARPPTTNVHTDTYGMGYQYIDQRLVEMQQETTQQMEGLRTEVKTQGQAHNQVRERVSGLTEVQKEAGEERRQLEERIKRLEIQEQDRKIRQELPPQQPQRPRTVSRSASGSSEAFEMAEKLRENFRLFANSIVAHDVMYGLFEKKALSSDDLEVIESIAANGQKTIRLLRILNRKKDPSWVFAFRVILEESDNDIMQNLAKILTTDNTTL